MISEDLRGSWQKFKTCAVTCPVTCAVTWSRLGPDLSGLFRNNKGISRKIIHKVCPIIIFYGSFLLPSLLPSFKGSTLFSPECHGSPESPLRPGPSKAALFNLRIFYCNGAIDNQLCLTRRCHALWTWVALNVFLLWTFQVKIC